MRKGKTQILLTALITVLIMFGSCQLDPSQTHVVNRASQYDVKDDFTTIPLF